MNPHDLDSIDTNIVRALASDARLSFAELGRRVVCRLRRGRARSPTRKRSNHPGVPRHSDEKAFGYSVIAFIRLTCENARYRPFLKFLPTLEAVQECHHITGGEAFLIKVTLSSIDQLEPLIERLLPYGMPTTSVALSTPYLSTTGGVAA